MVSYLKRCLFLDDLDHIDMDRMLISWFRSPVSGMILFGMYWQVMW